MSNSNSYIEGLNEAQREAVTADPRTPLQILAGPGSGKTKVLTCRVAHLINHHNIQPQHMVVVTFTNKAANEMRQRLVNLIGKESTQKLIIGTFHATCVRYLRRYGKYINLSSNFTIADTSDTKSIIKQILKNNNIKQNRPEMFLSAISKAKSQGLNAAEFAKQNIVKNDTIAVFVEYEKRLQSDNCLDFDDLLNYTVKLFQSYPDAVATVRHVLIDEFQDTNMVQYDLLKHFSSASKCASIVGDPDQSIYGWRNANSENLDKMIKDFKNVKQVFLQQNYRSTGSILNLAMAVVKQDPTRIKRSLYPTHTDGPKVIFKEVFNAEDESTFISNEILRLRAFTGNTLKFQDFVILLRFNAMSRSIEQNLQAANIPNRMLGGNKFFDRVEVKDILAYLRLAENPFDVIAFSRVINIPKRGIGPKSLEQIIRISRSKGISPIQYCQELLDNKENSRVQKISDFIKIIKFIEIEAEKIEKIEKNSEGGHVQDIISKLCLRINYQEYLKKTFPNDYESRWLNVQELLSFAKDIEQNTQMNFEIDEENNDTKLRRFLQATSLSTDIQEENDVPDEENNDKVTISTLHASKGLEYPVVFICGIEDGILPHSRSDDRNEERRLLYVGITRAKTLLYLSRAKERMFAGMSEKTKISPFITPILQNTKLLSRNLPHIDTKTRKDISMVLQRPNVDENHVKKTLEKAGVTQEESEISDKRTSSIHENHQFHGFVPVKDQFKKEIKSYINNDDLWKSMGTITSQKKRKSTKSISKRNTNTPVINFDVMENVLGKVKVENEIPELSQRPRKRLGTGHSNIK